MKRTPIRKFFIRGFFFSIPFLLYGLTLLLIDPFNYFFASTPLISNDVKQQTSGRIHYAIWKTNTFRRNFCANILFGDSRTDQLDVCSIQAVSGQPYFGLAMGGGTIPEVCALFDFAMERARCERVSLERVYIGLNFDIYTPAAAQNRVLDARIIMDNPLLYGCNYNVIRAAWVNVAVTYFGASPAVERPPMTREAFWQYQLDVSLMAHCRHYRYPTDYHAQLVRVCDECRTHGIRLAFIILPTHVDLQQRLSDMGLDADRQRFREDLAALATVYDFDYPNDLTSPPENFSDPFHAGPVVRETVIREVWGDPTERRFVRVYGKPEF